MKTDAAKGDFKAEPARKVEELARAGAESPEVKELKAKIKEMENKLEIAKAAGFKKEVIKWQDRLDEAQEKLAETLSPKFSEYKKEETEKRKRKLREVGIAAGRPSEETSKTLAELREQETQKATEETERIEKVREKIAAKPAEEIYFSNWPTGEKAKEPKEKPFTKTEEAWFAEGEKAGESEEEMKKLEETAKKRSTAGVSPKLSSKAPKETVELVKKADEKLDAAIRAIEDAKEKLKDENFDVNKLVAAGGFERFSIGLNIFTKRGRLLRRLYKDYIDAVNNRDLELLRAGNVSAERQKLRGTAAGSGRPHSGGGFFKGR